MSELPWTWGATAAERRADYPCARHLEGPRVSMHRAVAVAAPPELTYRWLCQMKLAPYSYDLVDNRGRRSPGELTPGVAPVVVGEPVSVFECLESVPGREWTGRLVPRAERLFGPVAVTYRVTDDGAGGTRLVCRLDVPAPVGRGSRLRTLALAWGDLVMMRKQLLTFKKYAERDAARPG